MTCGRERFASLAEAQEYIRERGTPDTMAIDGVLYTMDEFDDSGNFISYQNRRNNSLLEVATSDRYSPSKFSDAVLDVQDAASYRTGFGYAD
jgi:hypothetical protein